MFTGSDGQSHGLGPDLIAEAARRRGIRLEWVYCPDSADDAIRSGKVEMWPLLSVLPDRLSYVHFSRPYFRNFLTLVVLADSPLKSVADIGGKRVGHQALRINYDRVNTFVPKVTGVPHHNVQEGLAQLRSGMIDVLMVGELKLVSALMDRDGESSVGLRTLPSDLPAAELAVGGAFDAAPAVDALRDEIEKMSLDGTVDRLLYDHGVITRREITDLTAIVHTTRQVRRLAFALGIAACLALLGAALALAYRRQRNSARVAEIARRNAERDLRNVTNSLTDMVLAFDMNRRLLYANPTLERLTGYSAEELRQAGFIPWCHPEDAARMMAHWDALYVAQEFSGESYRLVRKDGQIRQMLAAWGPILDEKGVQIGVRGSERDITDLTEALSEMRLLAAAVAQATDAVVITDRAGIIQYVNPAFERVSGYSAAEVLGGNPRLLKSGAHDSAYYGAMWKCLLAGRSWTGQLTNRRKDGSLFTEHCTISPVFNEQGRIERYIAVKKDITQELALEEQVRQAQKMESIGKLAGGVAHDFNNLLTVISGNAQLAQRHLAAESPAMQRLHRVVEAADRAADLTRQLLAFGRKQPAQPELLDLASVVLRMEPVLSSLTGDNIPIRFEFDPGTPPVLMDRSHLQQVLMNLAVNARDAMEDGGSLTIRTTRKDGFAILEVLDTGHGIDPAIADRIFEPFYSTKEPGRGTGLGLAVVYGIVTQSGGRIQVDSQPGKGTRFSVQLPAGSGEVSTQPAGAPAMPAQTQATLLLVEDQPEVRSYIAEVLRIYRYRVNEAEDGVSALNLARSLSSLDILLTDLSMPGMNGAELAREVLRVHPGAAVLCMSGFAGEVPAGEFPLLQKPFSPDALIRALNRL